MFVNVMNVPRVGKFDLLGLQSRAVCGGASTHSGFCIPNFFGESIDVAQSRYGSVQRSRIGLAVSLRGHHISVVEVARCTQPVAFSKHPLCWPALQV